MLRFKLAILDRDETTMMRALAIIGILLHNLLHMCRGFVPENEFEFHPELPRCVLAAIPRDWAANAGNFFSFFGWYGVAVFVFLSGYGLVRKYEQGGAEFATGPFLVGSLGKLYRLFALSFVPFLLVDLVQMALGTWKGSWSELLVTGLLLNDPLVNWFYPSPGNLWYYGLALELYVVYALVRRIRPSALGVLALGCLLLAVGGNPALWRTQAVVFWIRHNFVGWLPVFALGLWWARTAVASGGGRAVSWRRALMGFVVSCGLVFAFSFEYNLWLLSPFFAVLATVCLVRILHRSAAATRVL